MAKKTKPRTFAVGDRVITAAKKRGTITYLGKTQGYLVELDEREFGAAITQFHHGRFLKHESLLTALAVASRRS